MIELGDEIHDIVNALAKEHAEKHEGLIKAAMLKHGFVLGENIQIEELSKRAVIMEFEGVRTLQIDFKNICCWTDFEFTSKIVDGQVKAIAEFKFKEL